MLLGTVDLGKVPRVVLAVSDSNLKENLFKAREIKVDLIEARLDLMSSLESDYVKAFFDTIGEFGFYSILTLRPDWEGGMFKGDEEERLNLIAEFLRHPAVVAVDIELRAEAIRKRIISLSKLLNRKVIISYHDFNSTPKNDDVISMFEEMKSLGADIVKFAFAPCSENDVSRICCLLNSIDFPKVFMLMGELGKITRVAGFSFGSLLTYTFFGEAVAPGQIEAERLVDLLGEFYVDYRKEKIKFV